MHTLPQRPCLRKPTHSCEDQTLKSDTMGPSAFACTLVCHCMWAGASRTWFTRRGPQFVSVRSSETQRGQRQRRSTARIPSRIMGTNSQNLNEPYAYTHSDRFFNAGRRCEVVRGKRCRCKRRNAAGSCPLLQPLLRIPRAGSWSTRGFKALG